MKKTIKLMIAAALVCSMLIQVCIPAIAEQAPDDGWTDAPVEIIYDAVAEPDAPAPDVNDVPEPIETYDEPDITVSPEPDTMDVPADSASDAAEIPAESVPDAADQAEYVPDAADPAESVPVAEDPDSVVPAADSAPSESQILPEDSSAAENIPQNAEDFFDVSDPDPSLWDFYVPSSDTSGNGAGRDFSSTRGLNRSNKEPAELNGYNFVLFGLSGHNSGDDNRSDTIMIVNVDPDRQEIKLISILRDTKAAIEGHEPQKINAAYKYGGAELALDTINKNFSLNLDQYITVDFQTLEDIVDMLGGIEIELSEEEAEWINTYSTEPVTSGLNNLNGEQALLYARIRKIDSDTVRAGRQQRVIQEILAKLNGRSFIDWLKVAIKVLETSEISMSFWDILTVISLPLTSYKMITSVVPDIEYETDLSSMIDEHGEWIWVYDLESAGNRIVDIINNQ